MKHHGLRYIAAAAVAAAAGCAGSNFRADRIRLQEIHRVAVVSLNVPRYVKEKDGGGAGMVVGMVRDWAKGRNAADIGENGGRVAGEVLNGFIAEMSKTNLFEIVPPEQVTAHPTFHTLAEAWIAQNKTFQFSTPAGLPPVPAERAAEFAGNASRALGVDGVLIVEIPELYYDLYTGINGTGQAKAMGKAWFKLYAGDGTVLWQDYLTLTSNASAAMVVGNIDPTAAAGLHTSIGEGIANGALNHYNDQAR